MLDMSSSTEATIGDTEVAEEQLLGTHTYEDVLYTGETDVVDVRTGRTPDDLDRSVQDAKEFVARTQSEEKAPRVARRQPPELAVESRSPYVSSVFCNRRITGSMEMHKAFLRAWRSEAYCVSVHTDYRTGTLEIEVMRA
jgi:hypothetical protein